MPIEKTLDSINIEVSHDGSSVFNKDIKTQDVSYNFTPEYWGSATEDVSLSGKIRDNTRGFKFNLDLDWSTSLEPDKIAKLLNNCIKTGSEIIDIVVTINSYTEINVRLADDSKYEGSYDSTIGYNIPSLSFVGEFILDEIPVELIEPWVQVYSNLTLNGFYSTGETADGKGLVVSDVDKSSFSDPQTRQLVIGSTTYNIDTIKANNLE